MKKNPTKSNRKLWLLPVCVLLLLSALFVYGRHYVFFRGTFLSRSAAAVDLRDMDLTREDVETLQRELPNCDILWTVPFQGGHFPSDTQRLTISSLTEEDAATLECFPALSHLDAGECRDYDQLLAFQGRHPDCTVIYCVDLGGSTYPQDTVSLSLRDPDANALEKALPYLPQLKDMRLSGKLPPAAQLLALQERFSHVDMQWEVSAGDQLLSSSAKSLDLSGTNLTYEDAAALLEYFPALDSATLRGCGLSDSELITLADRFPSVLLVWDMTIGSLQVPTDAVEIDISGQQVRSPAEIEALLPYFPNLQKVVMCRCGLDDETMDALNRRYEDIRFVWSVKIGPAWIRTDAKFFYPFTIEKDLVVDNEDLYPLRYCTDMEAIDIGHMTTVDNCEWAAFMPNLKYLIIVETAITDLTPLSGLKNLVFLEIFTTHITDYSPLLGCTALEDLNLGNTYGDPAPIAQMTWLKNLWWSGIAGTVGHPCSNAHKTLPEALPNTNMKFILSTPNVNNGWRQLENYYAMRDLMGVFYLS